MSTLTTKDHNLFLFFLFINVCHNKGVSLVLDDCTVNDKANERYYNTLTLLISFKNTEREN